MSHPPISSRDEDRPAGNQFSLRGLFVFTTALCVILALLALAIKQPWQWLGLLAVTGFCLAMIGVVEAGRKLFPAPPRYRSYELPPHFQNPLQTIDFRSGDNPFADESRDVQDGQRRNGT
jgi:hypothetical protein